MQVSAAGPGASAVHTMTGASANAPTRQKMSMLFDKIDASGSGSITSSQLSQAFATLHPPAGFQALGANALFSTLDAQHAGSVSKADFVNTMSALSRKLQSATAYAPTGTPTVALGGTKGVTINTTA